MGPIRRIRKNNVRPTSSACDLALPSLFDATNADNVRMKVPIASRVTPKIGLRPFTSFVEPRKVLDPADGNNSRKVSPASNPPAIWKERYGMKFFEWRTLTRSAPKVIAGFTSAPECFPRNRIIIATVVPKTAATKSNPSKEVKLEIRDVIITEVGPITTSMYVPKSSERHSLLQCEQGTAIFSHGLY
jgi:hypothetical protein